MRTICSATTLPNLESPDPASSYRELSGQVSGDELIVLIRSTFPDFAVEHWRLDRSGGDHLLLIVNELHAFRFPRPGVHDLRLEVDVLTHLRLGSAVPLPNYEYVDRHWRFGGYLLLAGVSLTASRFSTLSALAQDRVLEDIAHVLTKLHALSPADIAPSSRWRTMWAPEEAAAYGKDRHLPIIARHAPRLLEAVEAFYDRYATLSMPAVVVIHGDLVADHMLMESSGEQLSGIIDFGDVALGDPAHDFMGLWAFGEHAVRRTAQMYEGQGDNGALIARSREHFTRYQIDRLCDRFVENDHANDESEAALSALL